MMSRARVLCVLAALGGCAKEPTALMAVSNLPAQTTALQALIMLGEVDAQESPRFDLSGLTITPKTTYRFGLRLPQDSAGQMALAVAALDARGCLLALGDAAGLDVSALTTSKDIGVTLSPLSAADVQRCVQQPPFLAAVDPEGDAASVAPAPHRTARGWGFHAGASLSLVPIQDDLATFCDPAACPSAGGAAAGGVARTTPGRLAFDLPGPHNPSGLDPYCLVAANPDGHRHCRIVDNVRVDLGRAVLSPGPTMHPQGVALGDLDGDGLPDLAVSALDTPAAGQQRGVVAIYYNQGQGRFADPPLLVPVGASASSIAIGDLDGDGRPEVAAADPTGGEVRVLRNQGGRKFLLDSYAAGKGPDALVLADLDEDGRPDIAVVNGVNQPSMTGFTTGSLLLSGMRGGAGLFGLKDPGFIAGTAVFAMRAADLDGDHHVDLVTTTIRSTVDADMVTHHFSGGVTPLYGQGNGLFSPTIASFADLAAATLPLGETSGDLVIADMDGDGLPDLVVSGPTYFSMDQSMEGSAIGVLLNQGGRVFASAVNYATLKEPFALAAADMDHDGRPDLITVHPQAMQAGRVSLLLNQGRGVFPLPPQPTYPAGVGAGVIAAADLNQDGAPDLVVASFGVLDSMNAINQQAGTVTVYLHTAP